MKTALEFSLYIVLDVSFYVWDYFDGKKAQRVGRDWWRQ
jgi:hypothetical protein